MRNAGVPIVAALALLGGPAAAQAPVAPGHSALTVQARQLAEHNQLGLLEYCRKLGAIGDDILALQRAAIARMPGADTPGLAEAEALGRRGMVAFGASQVAVEQAAMGEGIPLASRCKQMAMTVQAQAGRKPTW